ncbi:MAG: helix-turn-helix transcriptional regulator [Clostridia bacterium]|nr:helix-turn-helix transcriptional regulator [Clostridia bacterium]
MYGLRIKELREQKGLSQKQLAKLLGSTQTKISKYEREAVDLSTKQILLICKIFNVTSDYLLGRSDNE